MSGGARPVGHRLFLRLFVSLARGLSVSLARGLSVSLALGCTLAASAVRAQELPPPIIDVHLHAQRATDQGPPPLGFCLPATSWPGVLTGASWGAAFLAAQKEPACPDPIWSAETDDELLERTLAIMERRNVIGVTSGARLSAWQERAPDRIIPGLLFGGGPSAPSLDSVRAWFEDGRVQVFAEVTVQYRGMEPGDPDFEPYLALAEELDVPVGIHIGPGPPGAAYLGFTGYRARLHSPLVLEDVLVRHPDLRLYVMHAGWPMIDDLLALLWAHPQVHVGLGIISYGVPRAEFHRYLRRIVEAGFGKRVMFGSDQMVWPEALEAAIQGIESADFLTEEQKRDILYHNAARFLRLSDEVVARHHGPSAQVPPRPEDTEVWEPVPPVVRTAPMAGPVAPPSDAIVLFGGDDLQEWINVRDRQPAAWSVADGVVTVDKSVGDIETRRSFRDYQLHVEWRVPEHITGSGQDRGNSGLFLAWDAERRAGYELQIVDSYENPTYVNGMAGSIYKQSIPLVNASRPPGEWQSYDVTWTAPRFTGDGALISPARVTVLYNGVLVQDDFVLQGETLFRGTPSYHPYVEAPLMLQAHGDPSPPISFRNIWIRAIEGGR